MNRIAKYFKFKERHTSTKIELIAGLTTFMTMAYVLVVQPGAIVGFGETTSIVDMNGIEITKEAIMVTCAIVSSVITLFMALYANLPFVLATGMGTNFVFGALIQSGELSFGGAMAMTLISGIIFVLLTIFGVRDLIVKAIPKNIKIAIGSAIGFFIAYLGFKNTGISIFSEGGIAMGDFTQPAVFLAILGIVIIAILSAYKINGAILIGIIIIALLGIPFGVTTLPDAIAKVPNMEGLGNIMFNLDFASLFSFSSIILIFVAFCSDFFSTLGTLLGVSAKANMLDADGNLPNIEKPFLVDAVGTCVGAVTGNTVITTFVESSAGVEAGGRTGFTSVIVSLLMAVMIFLSPLVLAIPDAATGPALIFVGFLMISGFKDIDFNDFTDSFGPFVMIMFTIFTASIAAGISAGILAFVIIKTATGRYKEVHPIMYVMAIPLIMYFIYG